jgi:PQQ-dependent dehydrogenase (methanol/ethanol family)
MSRVPRLAAAGSAFIACLCMLPSAFAAQRPHAQPKATPADSADTSEDLQTLAKDPRQWPMAPRNYANTRYSPLDQVNTGNAAKLALAWSFSVGANRGQEAAPLIINNTLYVVGPYFGVHPNQVFALDATTGALKWSYAPKPNPAAEGEACCDVVTRGLAYDHGKVFLATLDDNLVAIDAQTGQELWHTLLGDFNTGMTVTMAPLVVKGKVLVGNSGSELGVRGWVTAVDENSGKIAWRAYGTGPDKDVLIGPNFKPYYKDLIGKDLGVSTWPPGMWKIGGATMWGWIQYEPNLNLIYYGTANPSPWNNNQRPGDNLWTTTEFARNPDTGMATWAYQYTPHDVFDYDEINESLLIDVPVNGQPEERLVHVGRNGYIYQLDPRTGQVYSATGYDTINATFGIDLKTGRPIRNADKTPLPGKTVTDICPNADGAKDWQPSAYSPRTHLLYVPHQHLCMNWKTSEVAYIAGTPYVGATVDMYAGPGGYRGEFMAWDVEHHKKVWAIHENFPVWSGALVTGGDVAFYGTMDRWFKAVDARTGRVLWQIQTPSGIIGQPVSYQGSDGRQYVAILCGVGGWPGAVANAEIDPRVRNGALGFTGAMQDLPAYTAGGSTLMVFALPQAAAATGAAANGSARAGASAVALTRRVHQRALRDR